MQSFQEYYSRSYTKYGRWRELPSANGCGSFGLGITPAISMIFATIHDKELNKYLFAVFGEIIVKGKFCCSSELYYILFLQVATVLKRCCSFECWRWAVVSYDSTPNWMQNNSQRHRNMEGKIMHSVLPLLRNLVLPSDSLCSYLLIEGALCYIK